MHIYTHIHTFREMHVYTHACVCVHTCTHTYIYIYIYIYVCKNYKWNICKKFTFTFL